MIMTALLALIKRNIKLFFKDKGLFFAAMIVPMILLLLYATFLAGIYDDTFRAAFPEGIAVDEALVGGTVAGQMFASVLAVCSVTVAFCSNVVMVQDRYTGVRKDLTATPVKKSVLAVAYYVAAFAVTLIINFVAFGASLIYVACVGWYLSFADAVFIMLDVVLLSLFGTALSSVIHAFLSTHGQVSAVSTVVSAGYGFLCGAYMPLSQFAVGLRNTLMFFPGTYGTSLVKNHALRGVFEEMLRLGFPPEAVDGIKKSVDCSPEFFGQTVPLPVEVAVLAGAVALLLGAYVLINVLRKNRA